MMIKSAALVELALVDAQGGVVTVADLGAGHRAVVLFFMRASTCAVCLRHVRQLVDMRLPTRGVRPVVVVPGSAAGAERVRRLVGDALAVVCSEDASAHRAVGLDRTWLIQHSGTLLVDIEGKVRYRLAGTLPMGSFDGVALSAAISTL